MQAHYDVVVVGSGYGGAITACRVSQAGYDVCVLERGREMHPGEYPDRLLRAIRNTQARIRGRHIGDSRALFDFHLDGDMNVLVGCGLGGTSLINANVAVEPDSRVFEKLRWPAELRRPGALTAHYQQAREMLKPQRIGRLPIKSRVLAAAAGVSDSDPRFRAELTVSFAPGDSTGGVPQAACTGCGDCVTGCNVGAKNTVLMNYLPLAHQAGAHIFTEVEVRTVRHRAGVWLVMYRERGGVAGQFAGPTRIVTADAVVLGAGTLGTTEILLRSATAGLPLSSQVGEHFSGNGDVLAFGYDGSRRVNGTGVGKDLERVDEPPGPCISAMVTVDDGLQLGREVVVEDAVIPRALARILRPGLALASLVADKGKRDRPIRWSEILLGGFRNPYRGPSDRTQTFLVMSHDGPGGHLVLNSEHDRVQVDWPDAGTQRPYPRANRILRRFSRVLGGTFVPSPAWSKRMGRRLLTVHPLGGAVMADDAKHGVVDHQGRVFTGAPENELHQGLWVADGSMVPTPLGTNPLFTISALAERTSTFLLDALRNGPDLGREHQDEQERQDEPLEEAGDERSEGRVPLP